MPRFNFAREQRVSNTFERGKSIHWWITLTDFFQIFNYRKGYCYHISVCLPRILAMFHYSFRNGFSEEKLELMNKLRNEVLISFMSVILIFDHKYIRANYIIWATIFSLFLAYWDVFQNREIFLIVKFIIHTKIYNVCKKKKLLDELLKMEHWLHHAMISTFLGTCICLGHVDCSFKEKRMERKEFHF